MYTANDAIDIWIVERALGQGGMGSVYRCHNRDAKRILAAIKVLDYGLKRSPKARARFVREAEILFALDHPNIVKVRNVRLDADPPYLEMEFVEGGSLERRILEGAVPAPAVIKWLRQLASALSYLHGRGIRHRDVKPSNILVNTRGDATLVDFGIATEADASTLSESGQAMGSVAYVPPEWVHAGALDPVKWDLYALGVCAYEALTGNTAFGVPSGGMSSQRFHQVLTGKQGHAPLDPGATIPFGLRTLVRDLTQADPEVRIGEAAEVLARLDTIDLSDIRPDFTFPEANPEPPRGRRNADTPRGVTMVPDRVGDSGHGSRSPSNATTPPDAFESRPFVRPNPAPTAPTPAATPEATPAPPPAIPAPRRSALWSTTAIFTMLGLVAAAWALGRSSPLPAAPAPEPRAVVIATPTPPKPAEPLPTPPALKPASTPAPTPSPAAKPTHAPAAVPAATPTIDAPILAVAPKHAGAAITHAQLAAWLEHHPDWQHDAVIAAGKADEKYLKGWEGLAPPVGKTSMPAVAVTWSLATAYCTGHGGLAAVDAEPLKWTEGATQPWMEYRQEGGKPRWRRDDGVVSPQVEVTQSGVFIGFRCAR